MKMKMTTTFLAAAVVATALPGPAHAQSFDGADIEGFIAVIEGMEALADKYDGAEYAGQRDLIQDQMNVGAGDFGTLLDEDGQFRIFRLSTDAMAAAGDIAPARDYRALVKANGFDGLSDFGASADAIMMAWMATQVDPADLAEMEAMAPEVMAMMPTGVREQMAGVMRLAQAIENVPAEDVAALKPYEKRLDKAFD